MNTPVFKLEGVVKEKDLMSDFEGPLNLILQLLSKNKVEIKDISISLILEQYLGYLAEFEKMDIDVASEFVAMASHLAYIKTKTLLTGDEEVSELEQLISSLEQLKRRDILSKIREVTDSLGARFLNGSALLSKPQEYFVLDTEYKYSHNKDELLAVVTALMGKEAIAAKSINVRPFVYPRRETYSVSEKLSEIIQKLKDFGVLSLEFLFSESDSKSEVVATFIAILELCRIGSIFLAGDGEEMTASYTGKAVDLDYDMSDYQTRQED